MDKKLKLGSNPLEWVMVLGLRYYSILLTICLGILFYLYADIRIIKLAIIGMGIGFILLITKGVMLDLEDLSKRISSLEEKYRDTRGRDFSKDV